jgi:hypothetical protein
VIPLNINPNNVNISENRGFNSAIHDHIFRLGANYKFDPGGDHRVLKSRFTGRPRRIWPG